MTIRSPALHPIKRCVIKAFGLATNQHYFGAAGETAIRAMSGQRSSSRQIGRIFERFLHFLGHAHRYRGNPLGRLASEVLGLNKARVGPALRQELPGDSSHQTRGSQDCDVGLLAKGSLAFVEVPEVGRATNGNPSGLDEGASGAICCNVVTVCLEKFCPRCCGWKDTGRRSHKASEPRGSARCRRSR